MRILLTNDDGIHSEGLTALERVASALSDDVWTVAPETDQSGLSHSFTLSHPLRMRQIDDRRFAVQGTPTDCVIMAVKHILDSPPDLILSGINSGVNIADDVTYSGTVAGAIEGTLMGIRSIALSQAYQWDGENQRTVSYEPAEKLGPDILRKLIDMALPDGTLLNINFPKCSAKEVEGVEVTRQGRMMHSIGIEQRADGRGFPYYWVRFGREKADEQEGTDIQALRENRISVSALKLNLTDDDTLVALRDRLG
ncbi:5'/3'-nucleotidase SurE [Notoacmeibacter sp. MSK16QG-6]|uniref:5'/3'-nucleotidase SurE n=1 Tax=Notoacmeibacter sp. MSK16QG-6 TaxID=2957982 RepID=UPI0020A0E178|nr:5'/3'-nucleotidase SurE [Notoacmeibacter sp. MSK16QG-6]MCP1199386.1 5'/3'-nucleotidase SurE [Notoacmeibacter sp. MSK16QG-6]